MEASLRFAGPETIPTARSSPASVAWQNWIFQPTERNRRVSGALTLYGQTGKAPVFDYRRRT